MRGWAQQSNAIEALSSITNVGTVLWKNGPRPTLLDCSSSVVPRGVAKVYKARFDLMSQTTQKYSYGYWIWTSAMGLEWAQTMFAAVTNMRQATHARVAAPRGLTKETLGLGKEAEGGVH